MKKYVYQSDDGLWWVAVIESINYRSEWYTQHAAELALKAFDRGIHDGGSINRFVNENRTDGSR